MLWAHLCWAAYFFQKRETLIDTTAPIGEHTLRWRNLWPDKEHCLVFICLRFLFLSIIFVWLCCTKSSSSVSSSVLLSSPLSLRLCLCNLVSEESLLSPAVQLCGGSAGLLLSEKEFEQTETDGSFSNPSGPKGPTCPAIWGLSVTPVVTRPAGEGDPLALLLFFQLTN